MNLWYHCKGGRYDQCYILTPHLLAQIWCSLRRCTHIHNITPSRSYFYEGSGLMHVLVFKKNKTKQSKFSLRDLLCKHLSDKWLSDYSTVRSVKAFKEVCQKDSWHKYVHRYVKLLVYDKNFSILKCHALV